MIQGGDSPPSDGAQRRAPIWFWFSAIVLLVWGIAGTLIYVWFFSESPEEFARRAEIEANWEGYAEYVANIPWWAVGAGVVAAATRLLGAVGLLLRRAWARPLYVISTVGLSVALFRAFVLADVATVMSRSHVATEVVFMALSLYGVWLSRAGESRGLLR